MFRTLKSNSPFSAPRDDTARASCGNGAKANSYHSPCGSPGRRRGRIRIERVGFLDADPTLLKMRELRRIDFRRENDSPPEILLANGQPKAREAAPVYAHLI
jgi:hypothetical protein